MVGIEVAADLAAPDVLLASFSAQVIGLGGVEPEVDPAPVDDAIAPAPLTAMASV